MASSPGDEYSDAGYLAAWAALTGGDAPVFADLHGREVEAYLNNPLRNISAASLSVSGGVTIAGVFLGADGSAAAPSLSFTSDTNTGMYRVAADTIGFSTAGADLFRMDASYLRGNVNYTPSMPGKAAGSVSAPAYSFVGDTNTGMYRDAADSLSFATGGVQRLDIDSGGIKGKLAFRGPAGSAAAPTFAIDGDTNTGMYRVSSDKLGFSAGGVLRAWIDAGNGLYLASGDWFRTYGTAGWYNQTYGGGMYMTDTTWVKSYSAGLYSTGAMGGVLSASSSTSGYQYLMRHATYTGFIYYTSTREVKESIVDVTPADSGAWMDALQPVMFTERWLGEGVEPADEKGWREADVQVGFIAEEVLENDIISQFSQVKEEDGELKAVGWKWECVIAASVAEIKSLRGRLAAADDLNKTLDERLNILEKKV